MQNYSTAASRNLIRAQMDMLEHAMPITVLGDFGTTREMPKNQTDTLVFRRTLPFGASATGTAIEGTQRYAGTPVVSPAALTLAEGTTPNANTIAFTDISVTLQNFGILYKYSSKVELMYEDDIPAEMVRQTSETLAEAMELVRYGVLKAGSVVVYANGASRAAINSPISLGAVRKVIRTLESNRATRITSRLAPSVDYGTTSVQPAFVACVHTDVVADVRSLPGFKDVSDYGQQKPVHDMEIGSVEDLRFVKSPLFAPFLGAGAAVGATGMLAVNATNIDVYPIVVMGKDAWAQVALKGMGAISPSIIPPSERSAANPLGMFGYVGASTWFAAVRLNEAWMARLEVAVTAL